MERGISKQVPSIVPFFFPIFFVKNHFCPLLLLPSCKDKKKPLTRVLLFLLFFLLLLPSFSFEIAEFASRKDKKTAKIGKKKKNIYVQSWMLQSRICFATSGHMLAWQALYAATCSFLRRMTWPNRRPTYLVRVDVACCSSDSDGKGGDPRR